MEEGTNGWHRKTGVSLIPMVEFCTCGVGEEGAT